MVDKLNLTDAVGGVCEAKLHLPLQLVAVTMSQIVYIFVIVAFLFTTIRYNLPPYNLQTKRKLLQNEQTKFILQQFFIFRQFQFWLMLV